MMNKEEFNALREQGMQETMEMIKRVKENPDPLVTYKDITPILDIKHMIELSTEKYGDRPAFWVKKEKDAPFTSVTYREMMDDVNGLGTALIDKGLKGKKIAVIGENSYEWAISYFGAVCGTGVVVPLDKELPSIELKQLIVASGASCIIFAEKFEEIFMEMKNSGDTNLEVTISMNRTEDEGDILSFRKLVDAGKELLASGNREFVDAQIFRDEMSIILYTSGTTGVSKGVMLSHKNIVSDIMLALTVFNIGPDDVFLSVLPIHHTYECTCGFLIPMYRGASIAHCEGLKFIAQNLKEVRPTVFLGVPILFTSLYNKIWQNVRKKGKEDTLKKMIALNNKTKKIGIDIGGLFLKDIKAVFGGRMRIVVCGGAAINPDVLQGIRDFGILALQGYGLTETSPIGALNPDTAPVNASAGRALPEMQAKILDPDPETGIGEICLAGPNIMLGYFNNPEATAEVLKDGWYATGDLGKIDDKGYIFITGRKKNVIITKNGKNIYPEELEYYLSNIPYVLESMVWEADSTDGEDKIIASAIVPNEEAVIEKLGENYSEQELEKLLWAEIDKINDIQPYYKKIKRMAVRKEEFEKTTAKKIKRHVDSNKG